MTTNDTTVTVSQGDRAVAWRLLAPSASGGKVYTIAVHGSTVVTCWGRVRTAGATGAGSQARVLRYRAHNVAIAAAQQITAAKESEGYALDIPPRTITAPTAAALPARDAVSKVLADGTPL